MLDLIFINSFPITFFATNIHIGSNFAKTYFNMFNMYTGRGIHTNRQIDKLLNALFSEYSSLAIQILHCASQNKFKV